MEEKLPAPANGSLAETSAPISSTSAEHDEEKGDTLDSAPSPSPGLRDEKAETHVKAMAAVPEEPAKRKGKTALIMVAICVCKV